jgi:hypothetical protein
MVVVVLQTIPRPGKSANGKETMKVMITERVNLLTQWTKVSTAKCQQFTQWYNGTDSVLLTDAFEEDPAKRKVVALDCNEDNNKGLVCRHKIQLHIIDQLILHVLKKHLTTSSYKSFLAHKHEFSFIDEVLGNKIHSGLVLMRKMLDFCKPKTIVEFVTSRKNSTQLFCGPPTKTTSVS